MRTLAGLLFCGLVASGVAQAEDWPHWRGPDGRRISNERGLPTRWSRDTVVWQTPLRGLGVSSPIVSGDLVFLTSQIGRGPLRPGGHPALVRGGPDPDGERPLGGERAAGNGDGIRFLVSAFNRADGSVAWEYEIEPEPRGGRREGVCVVRHWSIGRTGSAGRAGLGAPPGPRLRAVRDRVGALELAHHL